jgi:RNA polymerase sigma-70 factor (family 1)
LSINQPYNEHELLSRIAEGDETAFTHLFHTYRARVYTLAIRLTGENGISEEIVQDVFLKLWLKRERIPAIDNFPGFLVTVTQNTVYSAMRTMLRRKKHTAEYQDIPSLLFYHDTEDLLDEKDLRAIINQAINRLPPQQKQAYLLIKEDGLSRENAARQMKISPETVKAHLAQALRSIRVYCLHRLDVPTVLLLLSTLPRE